MAQQVEQDTPPQNTGITHTIRRGPKIGSGEGTVRAALARSIEAGRLYAKILTEMNPRAPRLSPGRRRVFDRLGYTIGDL
jgi:hypothetical protein